MDTSFGASRRDRDPLTGTAPKLATYYARKIMQPLLVILIRVTSAWCHDGHHYVLEGSLMATAIS